MLNLDTLLLVQLCVALLTAALLAACAFRAGAAPAQRWWAAGALALAAAAAAAFGASASARIAADLLAAAGLALLWRGLRDHDAAAAPWPVPALATAVALPISAWLAPGAGGLAGGLYLALLCGACALALARRGPWRAATAAGFVLLGLAFGARGLPSLAGLAGLAAPLAQIAIAFGLTQMLAARDAERLGRLATLDPLTGTLNRAGLDMQGKRACLRAQRGARSLALVMLEVDDFAPLLQRHGAPAGDEVLRHLAHLLGLELRPQDLLARFDTAQFALVLDAVDRAAALSVAERLRTRIEQEAAAPRYTVSAGVACSDQRDYDLIGLASAADAAMRAARRAGGNRVAAD